MNYSKIHRLLSFWLDNDPEVFEHPEKFLGPNYKMVLDFWAKIDRLTEEQDEKFYQLCDRKGDLDVIGYSDWCVARTAAWDLTLYDDFIDIATYELMAMPFLLKQGHELVFAPLIKQCAS
jgi:hypothetical protein